MPGTRFRLECQPALPENLSRLHELANNMLYSWDRGIRGLFFRLDPDLWECCGHNPKLFLRQVSQKKIERAASDNVYIENYRAILSSFDTYLQAPRCKDFNGYLCADKDLVAYFCAEFGFHESLPIYSGGLGILAGDHCKAASDLGVPFVALGILYRQGYFRQQIDGEGNQIAVYSQSKFADLPIESARDESGKDVYVSIELPGREVHLKVWVARVGHISLYLLDSDLPENTDSDRKITYQLYGGDREMRLQQEMVLGIGGVRAKKALGLLPTVWHINEGHSAFQIIERCRELIETHQLDFHTALEVVAACTVFTTHTPVPAGHDVFDYELITHYFADYVKKLNISLDEFLSLGKSNQFPRGFNMTAFALRGSRFHNGVSRIHGTEASRMESYIWPQIPPEENPMRYVTNGIHVLTFLAHEWVNRFDLLFGGGWRTELSNRSYWECIDSIASHSFWSIRQTLKSKMIEAVAIRLKNQLHRNGESESQIKRLTAYLNPQKPDFFTIGFARRFATYKRATLILSDPERLARLVNNPQRPVVLIFAGKAHPNDQPGQDLIRTLHHYSRDPRFEGKIILVEDFDMALARKLVSGVDLWLNNPEYPKEASGTSGEKAGINGVLNLSVLDGWWGEGFEEGNGWAITPHGSKYSEEFRDREESREMLDLLEQEIIPLYYDRDGHGYSTEWVQRCKNSMKTILPRFNAQRMVMDYVREFYAPAAKQHHALQQDDFQSGTVLSVWKKTIHQHWHNVSMRLVNEPVSSLRPGERLQIDIALTLGQLSPGDVVVDCLIGTENSTGEFEKINCHTFQYAGTYGEQESLFRLDCEIEGSGLLSYMIRAFPYHELQCQRFEMGYMLWL
jgi:starch phosphorylase